LSGGLFFHVSGSKGTPQRITASKNKDTAILFIEKDKYITSTRVDWIEIDGLDKCDLANGRNVNPVPANKMTYLDNFFQ
jgi:hypothetical protein